VLVRGLNALAATISTPQAAPVIAGTRLRGGSANTARGAASFAAEAIGAARAAGCTGLVVARMDSGYCNAAVCQAVRRAGAYFSITARMDPAVKAAIAAIPEDAWAAIKYPRAIWDDQLRAWVSDAEIAEIAYTAFASKKGQAVTARLIVRRVKDLNRKAGEGQDELFPVWRCHPVFTDSPFTLAQAEEQHRDHAVVEQVFADRTERAHGSHAIGIIRRQRRLAGLRRDHAQPGPRRWVPGLALPRQSQGRHHPGRPDRRGRPYRPPRPRPADPAPAAVLAPRGRVAQPVRGCLRPACPGGLTSPDRSPRLHGHAPPGSPPPLTPIRKTRTSRRTVNGRISTPAETPRSHSPARHRENDHLNLRGGLRLMHRVR
jgi:hypothetical protein